MVKVYSPEIGYVDIPEKPTRIISLSPSATETIFYLGAGDRIVGVDAWSYRPREALNIRRVGSYTTINIDLVRELDPDLIITTTGVQRPLIEKLREITRSIYPIPVPTSIYEIFNNILLIGGLIGEYKRAQDLVQGLLKRLITMIEDYSLPRRYRVYIEIDLGGPTIPGYFSHITSALALFNLDNIFGDNKQSYLYGFKVGDYPILDLEEVKRRDPDLIIYEGRLKKHSREEILEIFRRRNWLDMRAVRENKFITIPVDTLAHYGPSFLDNLEFVLKEIRNII
ncbi:MAG: ABC transporter substrate-binding protein [Sulfolobales archaeon]